MSDTAGDPTHFPELDDVGPLLADARRLRRLQSRAGALKRWAGTADHVAATTPARRGLDQRFEREAAAVFARAGIVPSPAQLARKAATCRRAFFSALAVKKAQKHRERVAGISHGSPPGVRHSTGRAA